MLLLLRIPKIGAKGPTGLSSPLQTRGFGVRPFSKGPSRFDTRSDLEAFARCLLRLAPFQKRRIEPTWQYLFVLQEVTSKLTTIVITLRQSIATEFTHENPSQP